MTEPGRPGIAARVRAALRHERDASDLEALRAAGNWVYEELARTEQARAQLLADGHDLGTLRAWPAGTSSPAGTRSSCTASAPAC